MLQGDEGTRVVGATLEGVGAGMNYLQQNPDQSDLGSGRVLFSRAARLTRASTKRSSIWKMTPGCFLTTDVAATGTIGVRATGGDIFSNEKAGMVHPLVVELKHSRSSPGIVKKTTCNANRCPLSNADVQIQA
jgi:hypothetical protein